MWKDDCEVKNDTLYFSSSRCNKAVHRIFAVISQRTPKTNFGVCVGVLLSLPPTLFPIIPLPSSTAEGSTEVSIPAAAVQTCPKCTLLPTQPQPPGHQAPSSLWLRAAPYLIFPLSSRFLSCCLGESFGSLPNQLLPGGLPGAGMSGIGIDITDGSQCKHPLPTGKNVYISTVAACRYLFLLPTIFSFLAYILSVFSIVKEKCNCNAWTKLLSEDDKPSSLLSINRKTFLDTGYILHFLKLLLFILHVPETPDRDPVIS